MRLIWTAISLAALWLLMSGIYKPLLLILGALSVLLVLWLTDRMNKADGDRLAFHLRPIGFIGYLIWLGVEIAKANIAVTKVILAPAMPIRQHMFRVPSTQKSDVGHVIFANSITLTPGTISVETEPDEILVHALAYHEADLTALADMDARVSATETPGAA